MELDKLSVAQEVAYQESAREKHQVVKESSVSIYLDLSRSVSIYPYAYLPCVCLFSVCLPDYLLASWLSTCLLAPCLFHLRSACIYLPLSLCLTTKLSHASGLSENTRRRSPSVQEFFSRVVQGFCHPRGDTQSVNLDSQKPESGLILVMILVMPVFLVMPDQLCDSLYRSFLVPTVRPESGQKQGRISGQKVKNGCEERVFVIVFSLHQMPFPPHIVIGLT